jgi:hypothetical protein
MQVFEAMQVRTSHIRSLSMLMRERKMEPRGQLGLAMTTAKAAHACTPPLQGVKPPTCCCPPCPRQAHVPGRLQSCSETSLVLHRQQRHTWAGGTQRYWTLGHLVPGQRLWLCCCKLLEGDNRLHTADEEGHSKSSCEKDT